MEKPEGWKAKGKRIFILFPLTGLKTQSDGIKLPAFWKICKPMTTFFFSLIAFEFCKFDKKGEGV